MALADVIEQKHGSAALSSTVDSATESIDASTGAADSPSVKMSINGREYSFDTQTLILYGVVLADILLLYIALGG